MTINNKHVLKTFVAAMAVAAFCSCSKKEPAVDNTIEFETLSMHEIYRLENTAKVFMSENDVCYEDSAIMFLPVKIYGQDITALRDTIIKAAFDTIAAPEEAMKSYFSKVANDLGYNAVIAPDSVPRTDADGMSLIEGEIFSMSPEILTYRVSNYQYFPAAAHGLTTTQYINYNIPEGKILTLSNLFTPEGLEKLPAMLQKRARQLVPAIGPTSIDALPTMGNFYISLDEAIVFVYQPYEVASYAQGAIAISFYPYQLTELLTPEGQKVFHLE